MSGLRWTEEELERYRKAEWKQFGPVNEPKVGDPIVEVRSHPGPPRVIIGVRQPIRAPGFDPRMNQTEAGYALVLEAQRIEGEIKCWKFEAIKLRLADRTYYTPDFAVWGVGGELEFHETKGFWRDDARVKIKVAAAQFQQFRFYGLTKIPKRQGGGWKVESF